jgi:hypothetical protein
LPTGGNNTAVKAKNPKIGSEPVLELDESPKMHHLSPIKKANIQNETSFDEEFPTIENYDPFLNNLNKPVNHPQSVDPRPKNNFRAFNDKLLSPDSNDSVNSNQFHFKKAKPENTKSAKPMVPSFNKLKNEPPSRDLESEVRHRVREKIWQKRKDKMKQKLRESS